LNTNLSQPSKEIFELYKELQIDCLVMPGFPVPAFQHGLSQKLMYGAMYTFVHNAIDVPTAAIPIS